MQPCATNVKAARTEKIKIWNLKGNKGLFFSKINYFFVAGFIIFADRISKRFFENYLLGIKGHSVEAIGSEFARFTLAYNTGIAFSIPLGGRYVLSAVSLIASAAIVYLIIRTDGSKKCELWGYSLILGGAVGNMTDRIVYGRVIDFIDCDFFDLIIERWPIFNLADSFITIGMIFLFVHFIFLDKRPNKKSL
ncbi:MAG: signal peptidase II [Candidatus Delongbacteria bacterium]